MVPAVKKHTATVIMAHGLGDRLVSTEARWPKADNEIVVRGGISPFLDSQET